MNYFRILRLSALLVALSAVTAVAALTGDSGSDAKGIEMSGDEGAAQHHVDQLFALENMSETTLQRHAKSAQRAQAPMDGHYGRDGSEAAQLFGQQELSQFMSHHAVLESLSDSIAYAQAAAVHMVGSGAVIDSAPPAMSVGSGSSVFEQVQTLATPPAATGTGVPVPPSVLLLASGLFGLPLLRRRFVLPGLMESL